MVCGCCDKDGVCVTKLCVKKLCVRTRRREAEAEGTDLKNKNPTQLKSPKFSLVSRCVFKEKFNAHHAHSDEYMTC